MPKQYTTEERRLYQREYRADGREKGRDVSTAFDVTRPFCGFDGEGGNLENGYHAYFLCASGQRSILPSGGNVRLTSTQCLEFISSLDPAKIHVVFFGDYDVTKILEDLPTDKLTRLMDRRLRTRKDGRGVFPVSYGQYELDYLPRKEFKVRKNGGKWIAINDVGPFFQCRFVEALEKWDIGTAEEREIVQAGKETRGTFDYADIVTIRKYCLMEIKLLENLMEKFRDACISAEIIPARWQGPGQLAEALFRKNGVPVSKNVPLLNDPTFRGLMDFGRAAFYGGRPEIGVIGPVDVPVFQADINSAYPHAMQYLPCLEHGGWENRKFDTPTWKVPGEFDQDHMALVYGSFSYEPVNREKNPPMYAGLPTRTKQGTIVYPLNGRGWYWSFEIDASIHQRFEVEEVWTYSRQCECTPMGFVLDVYRQRKAMGKDGAGIVLKLALNSLYGKTCQSIGFPKYANPVWASFITAFCRSMIQGLLHSSESCVSGGCGQDVLMIATDSVCITRLPDEVDVGEGLGQWSIEEHPGGMFLVQPGLYFGTSGKPSKTRGVPRSVIEEREGDFREAFHRLVESKDLKDGDLRVQQHMFVGIKYALHRRNMKLLGQWIEFTDLETGESGKRITFDWHSKRAEFPVLSPLGTRTWLTTFPQLGDSSVQTVPYSKDIGGVQTAVLLRGLFEAQPDWGEDLTVGFGDDR